MKYLLLLLVLLGCKDSGPHGFTKESNIGGCFQLNGDAFCHQTQVTKLVNTCSIIFWRDFDVCTADDILMEQGYEMAAEEFCGRKFNDCKVMEETYTGTALCTEIHVTCSRKR